MQGQTRQEDVQILGVYAPNNTASKHTKEKVIELQGKMNKPPIMVCL